MRALLDTGVLLRLAVRSDPWHGTVRQAVDGLLDSGAELLVAPQNIYGFWVVATRPVRVRGFGLPVASASSEVRRLTHAFVLLDDPPGLLHRWLTLCLRYRVGGVQAHDARLVAFMLEHGVTHLVTLNPADFSRYRGITVLSPEDMTSNPQGHG